MSRRLFTVLAALVPAVLLLVLATSATVPLVSMGPGPTYDTFGTAEVETGNGEVEQVPVIDVVGRPADETAGSLLMTTVAVRDRLTLVDAARFWLDPAQVVVPRDQVFPPDRSRDEVRESNAAQMVGSENSAEAAAYRHLGIPMQPRVEGVEPDGAVAGRLEEGDVLTSIDGEPVEDATSVVERVGERRAGDEITIGYTRDGREGSTTTRLQSAGPDGDPDQGRLGILVGDSPADGTDVDITVDPSVGGPSAGLVLALAIVDKLSPGETTGGARVAGSGTILPDGTVGSIGGIRHKIRAAHEAGASEFLVPAANCAEAVQDPPEGIRLIEVSTLGGAVEALETAASGGRPPTCG
ncbi:PDZ domain-containing protein [Dietzia cinnamea]|uniref:YlbL family protein n=1 Tax=Dietzia cinnamea TaxID=321318 RepID=UPI0021AE86A8|nr:PDZ domain-containing protein [Dietzia cinnamea]MCT1712447.1 PDZ domain-containing protein [Dietzia cinnamea]MCT2263804.1 PDZ domain-containing protein [Dietzia cinnamea]